MLTTENWDLNQLDVTAETLQSHMEDSPQYRTSLLLFFTV